MTQKTILTILLLGWVIFSVVYISLDIWNDFKKEQLSQAYNLGKTDTINAAIRQAENEKCEPFSIFSNEKQVQIINIKCLKPPEPTAAPSKK